MDYPPLGYRLGLPGLDVVVTAAPDVRLRKGASSGWRADTVVDLAFNIEGNPAQLALQTYKYEGYMVTYAKVHTTDGGFTTQRVFRDFHERLFRVPGVRCTEKTVTAQHSRALTDLDALVCRVVEHHRNLGDLP